MAAPAPGRDLDPSLTTVDHDRPAPRGSHAARWVYRLVFAFVGGGIVGSAIQAILVNGFTSMPGWGQLGQTYVGRLASQHPFFFWPVSGMLIIAGGWGYYQDQSARRRYVADAADAAVRRRLPGLKTGLEEAAAKGAETGGERGAERGAEAAVLRVMGSRLTSTADLIGETPLAPAASALVPRDFSGTKNGLPLPAAAAKGRHGEDDEKGLIGRDEEQQWLTTRILGGKSTGVWAVSGMGGIGKTALVAICIANLKDRLTGGVAVVRAGDIVDPAEVLRRLVHSFVPYGDRLIAQSREATERLSAELMSTLLSVRAEGKLAVVVIDNVEPALARDPELKTLLDLMQTSGVSVVLTSREQLPPFYVQESLPLDTLDEAECIKLFARLSGRFEQGGMSQDDRQEIAAICRTFQGHALATVLAAAELQQHPGLTLAMYRDRLAAPYAVLDIADFKEGDAPTGVSQVFASSYGQLTDGAQRLLAALGVLADRGCTVAAAVALGVGLGHSEAEAQEHLDRLIVSSLVNVVYPNRDRVEFHPLVQQFSRRLFDTVLSSQDADRVRGAMAVHYASWTPGKNADDLRLDASNLIESLRWARRHTPAADAALAGLTFGLRWYWDDRFETGPAFDWLPPGYSSMERLCRGRTARRLASAAFPWPSRRRGAGRRGAGRRGAGRRGAEGGGTDWRKRQSTLAFALGIQFQLNGKIPDAARWFTRSRRAARKSRDPVLLAEALSGLAAVAQQRGKSALARKRYLKSLALFEHSGDRHGRADALYRLGFLALRVGDTDSATSYFRQSLDLLHDGAEDERLRGVDYYSLGNVSHQTGHLTEARQRYQEGLDSCERINNLRGKGAVLKALGDLAWQTVGPDEALDRLAESQGIFRQIFDGQAEGVATHSYAFVQRQIGQIDAAAAHYRNSLSIRLRVKDRRGEAFVRKGLGDLRRRTAGGHAIGGLRGAAAAAVRADMRGSRRLLTKGMRLSRKVGDLRNTAAALKALGDWAWQSGNLRLAGTYYERSVPIRAKVHDRHGGLITRKALADLALARGRLDLARGELDECRQAFQQLGDVRGGGAVLHSQAVLAVRHGDVTAARTAVVESIDLFRSVSDQQCQAVATYTLACLAETVGDLDEASRLYRDGLESAHACRAVHIYALLAEGHGNVLVGRDDGHERDEGASRLRHAAELFRGLGRPDDAKRCLARLRGGQVDEPADRIARALIYDLDDGPNGQGFAVPNDRRRTTE